MRNERTTRMLHSALGRESGVQNYVFADLTADLRYVICPPLPVGTSDILFLYYTGNAICMDT